MHYMPTEKKPQLLGAHFNQSNDCFAVSYKRGFRVYNTDPLDLRVKREFEDGGIHVARMLHRTNYLALVGGGPSPKFPQNKVVIWDDIKGQVVLSLEFLTPVIDVLMSRTHVVVVLECKIHIHAFSSPPVQLAVFDKFRSPHAIAALAGDILAFPSPLDGQIQAVDLSGLHRSETPAKSNAISIIRAHKGPIRCLALSPSGQLLASASQTGTIIRLFSTDTTTLLHEFRRGLDRAIIYSIAFNPASDRLAVLSDKSTLHVFDTEAVHQECCANRQHVLARVPLLPQYFSSKWSFASARVTGTVGVLGWSSSDSIVIVWVCEARWEKYAIVESEPEVEDRVKKWDLVREAWRRFDGLLDA